MFVRAERPLCSYALLNKFVRAERAVCSMACRVADMFPSFLITILIVELQVKVLARYKRFRCDLSIRAHATWEQPHVSENSNEARQYRHCSCKDG